MPTSFNQYLDDNMKPQASNVVSTSSTTTTTTIQRMTPMIICGYIFNTLLYLLLAYVILPKTTTTTTPPLGGGGGVAAASQHCHPTAATAEAEWRMTNAAAACTRPSQDIMAFQIVSFINLSYLGLLGTHTFFLSSSSSSSKQAGHPGYNYYRYRNSSTTPIGRCFGSLPPEADYINAAIVIYQGWDFIMTYIFTDIVIGSQTRIIMLTHHALAFICGYSCLIYEVRTQAVLFCSMLWRW